MLNQLSKNQYVKISNCHKNEDTEYGIVLTDKNGKYDIMSIGFKNERGKFIEYPTDVEDLIQTYTINDATFDEVKEDSVRRKMNIWMEKNYKM